MSSKPSILFINQVYPPAKGATGRLLRDLAQGFAQDGWDVRILTTGPKKASFKDGSVSVTQIKTGTRKTYLSYFRIWLGLLNASSNMARTDLIVTMTDPPLLPVIGRILAERKNMRHIHWCQEVYPDLLSIMGIKLPDFAADYLLAQSRRAMKTSDKIIVIGRCMAKYLARTGVDPAKLTVIPNWPDRELLEDHGEKADVKAETAPSAPHSKPAFVDQSPKFRVLYAGNPGRIHPIETMMEAAKLLQNNHPEIEFLFVGEGEGHDRAAEFRARHGLENIRFLPSQPAPRLKDMMESGDVHLIGLKDSAVGMAVPTGIYAGLASGRPCIFIGPENSEAARILLDYKAGTIVPDKNEAALAEAILSFRLDGDHWFAARQGAVAAAKALNPDGAIQNWIKRARDVIGRPQI